MAEINTQAKAIGATYTAMTPIGITVVEGENDTLSFHYEDNLTEHTVNLAQVFNLGAEVADTE